MVLPLLSHVSDYRGKLFAVEGCEAIFGLPGKGNRHGHLVVHEMGATALHLPDEFRKGDAGRDRDGHMNVILYPAYGVDSGAHLDCLASDTVVQ